MIKSDVNIMLLNGFDTEIYLFIIISGMGSRDVDIPDIPQSMMVGLGFVFELLMRMLSSLISLWITPILFIGTIAFTISSEIIDVQPQPIISPKVNFSYKKFRTLAGVEIDKVALKTILQNLSLKL